MFFSKKLGFNFRMGGEGLMQALRYYLPALSNLTVARGIGPVSFTRDTKAWYSVGGILTEFASGVAAFDAATGVHVEPAATNLFLNSAIGVTQNITVTAQAYTLSFYGTGNIVRSGVSSGTLTGTGANNRVSVTFTPTAGTLTLTVNGTCTDVQLETGPFATSPILTTGAATTRNATVIASTLATANVPNGDLPMIYADSKLKGVGPFGIKLKWTPDVTIASILTTAQCLWSSYADASNYLAIWYNGVILYAEKKVGGNSEYVTISLPSVTAGTTYTVFIEVLADNKMELYLNGLADKKTDGTYITGLNEILLDTGFDDTTKWSKLGFVVSSSTASITGAADGDYCRQGGGTRGKLYFATTDIESLSGSIRVYVAGVSVFQIYTNTTGVKTAYLTGGTGSTVGINTVTGASAVVNSLSIQEVFNTSTTAAPVLGSTFQLGGFNGTQQIIGTIKDVSIYNRALPAGQTI